MIRCLKSLFNIYFVTLFLSGLFIKTNLNANSRLYIHNNTDTPLFVTSINRGLARRYHLDGKYYKLQPKRINPYEHISILKFDRRSGLKRNKEYQFIIKLEPEDPGAIRVPKNSAFEIKIKIKRGRTTKKMWHSWKKGEQRSKWYSDKKWRTARWGNLTIRFRERPGTPDANLEFQFIGIDRPLLRFPIKRPKMIKKWPIYFYDLKETKGDDKDFGERDGSGVTAAHCKNFMGERILNCYGGHSGTDYMLKGGFTSMDMYPNYIVAARAGKVVEVVDCYYDRCHLGGKAKPDCDGNNINEAGKEYQGNHIIIMHDKGIMTRYWHIKKGSALVGEGEFVKCGEPIASIGSSGRSIAPHLHFEVRVVPKIDLDENGYLLDGKEPSRIGYPVDPYKGKYTGRTFWYKGGDKRFPSTKCAPHQSFVPQTRHRLNPGRTLTKTCDKRRR